MLARVFEYVVQLTLGDIPAEELCLSLFRVFHTGGHCHGRQVHVHANLAGLIVVADHTNVLLVLVQGIAVYLGYRICHLFSEPVIHLALLARKEGFEPINLWFWRPALYQLSYSRVLLVRPTSWRLYCP